MSADPAERRALARALVDGVRSVPAHTEPALRASVFQAAYDIAESPAADAQALPAALRDFVHTPAREQPDSR